MRDVGQHARVPHMVPSPIGASGSVDMAGQIQIRIHNSHRFHGTDVDSIASSGGRNQ